MAVMVAAALAAWPLGLIGWEAAAGLAFVSALATAWIAAAGGFIVKLWRG
jgi:hypothetical protein